MISPAITAANESVNKLMLAHEKTVALLNTQIESSRAQNRILNEKIEALRAATQVEVKI